jgi:hypothetical protein
MKPLMRSVTVVAETDIPRRQRQFECYVVAELRAALGLQDYSFSILT